MLKTSAFGLGFQQHPRDLVNVNAWKTMFDPYNIMLVQRCVPDMTELFVQNDFQIFVESIVILELTEVASPQ